VKHKIGIVTDRDTDENGYYPINRGGKKIFVDDELWGRFRLKGHGCHGNTYELQQLSVDGGFYDVEAPRGLRGKLVVWSDKQYLRSIDPKLPPQKLEERLTQVVEWATKAGLFQSPAALRAKTERELQAWRDEKVAKELQLGIEWDAQIKKALAAIEGGENAYGAISAAMHWAKENAR